MVELKIRDADSLWKLVEALTRNGYKVATFVVWKNGKIWDIDYFTVEVYENG